MIWNYLDVFTNVRKKQRLIADDNADKLNRSTTVIILVIASIFIFSKNFGIPIKCLEEQTAHGKLDMGYVESVCWAKETMRLDNFFDNYQFEKKDITVSSFYPWMPLITVFLAFCFYLPYLIWTRFVRKNNYHHMPIDINGVIEMIKKSSVYKKEEFSKNITLAGEYLDRVLSLNNFNDGYLDEYEESTKSLKLNSNQVSLNKEPKSLRDRRNNRVKLVYIPLILKYLFIKIVYLLVSIFIFEIINKLFRFRLSFLKFGSLMFNKYVVANDTDQNDLTMVYFPRYILCDITHRADMANTQRLQYQCALPANIFNEKVFFVLWIWLIFMAIVNIYSLIKWCLKIIFRRTIILNMLLWPFKYNYHNIDKYIDSFVYEYLSTEGYLALMIIKSNTQDWHTRSLVRLLWKHYISRFTDNDSCEPCQTYPNNTKRLSTDEIKDIKLMNLSSPSTAQVPSRRDLNSSLGQDMATPSSSTNSSNVGGGVGSGVGQGGKSGEKECKNNYKPNNEFMRMQKEDMV